MELNIPYEAQEVVPDEPRHRLALQEYLAANYARLQRRLTHYLGCADMASESLHDTWLRLGSIEMRAVVLHPEAYIYRMAYNVAVDRLRSNRAWQYVGDMDTELEYLIDPTPDPVRVAEARADVATIDLALERLPKRSRSVLVGLRVDEMSRQEIATRYGLSLRTVDNVLRQALDHCAQCVDRGVTKSIGNSMIDLLRIT